MSSFASAICFSVVLRFSGFRVHSDVKRKGMKAKSRSSDACFRGRWDLRTQKSTKVMVTSERRHSRERTACSIRVIRRTRLNLQQIIVICVFFAWYLGVSAGDVTRLGTP